MKCPNQLCQSVVESEHTRCLRCGLPLPGALLGDRFELDEFQRTTPVAVVYGAWDRQRLDSARVRVFIPKDGRSIRGLETEMKALQGLAFDQTPAIYRCDLQTDFPWVAEGQLDGTTMADRLLRHDRPFTEPEVVEIMRGVATALDKLHGARVIHRDIRPESVAQRSDGKLVLGAPGWERELQDRPRGRVQGIYTAPELMPGHASAQTDLYSLGVLAIHLLTGVNPEGLYQPELREFSWAKAAKASPRLVAVVDSLVADTPSKRIKTASNLLQRLSKLDDRAADDAPTGDDAAAAEVLAESAVAADAAEEGAAVTEAGHQRRWFAGLAVVLASLLASLARLGRSAVAFAPGIWTANGIRILVALGLLAGGLLAHVLLVHHPSSGLPAPVIGQDDQAIPVAPDIALPPLPRGNPAPFSVAAVARPPGGSGGGVPGQDGGNPGGAAGAPGQSGGNPGGAAGAPGQSGGNPGGAAGVPGQSGGNPGSAAGVPGQGGGNPGGAGGVPGQGGGNPGGAAGAPGQSGGNPGGAAGAPGQSGGNPGSVRPSASAHAFPPANAPEAPGKRPGTISDELRAASPYFIRVNTVYHTLTVYRDGQFVAQFPVTTGKGASTPEGRFVITKKVANPSDGRIPGGSPHNPIGSRWLGLNVRYPDGKGIGIHGTDEPGEIGMSDSGGCIRLRDQDVDKLYKLVPAGTPVEIL